MKHPSTDIAPLPAGGRVHLPTRPKSDQGLRGQLREQLLALPYRSFLQVISRLLEKEGATHVRPAGRDGFVGRNRSGGWDLEAMLPEEQGLAGSGGAHRCIVQVKQFGRLTVQQRTVDELRGCTLRAGASQGLLLTTSDFSQVARRAALSSPLAPIRLLDGETLLTLLIQNGLGVRRWKGGSVRLDPEFFVALGDEQIQDEQTQDQQIESVVKHDHVVKQNHVVKQDHPAQAASSPKPQPLTQTLPQETVLRLSLTLGAKTGGRRQPESAKESGRCRREEV